MSLHILNQSGSNSAIDAMLKAISEGDAVILIEDGVLAALPPKGHALMALQCPVYLLEADVMARGIHNLLPAEFSCVDDAGFVTLCCEHDKTVSWF